MTDINGGVEFRWMETWARVVEVSPLVFNDSDLFGCLFGVRNYAQYAPLFADRGIPSDVSSSLAADLEGSRSLEPTYGESWVSWAELKRVDWGERAVGPDERIHEFVVQNGVERFVEKWGKSLDHDVREALDRDPAATITKGDRISRRPYVRRRAALDGNRFPLVMKLMACLAEEFGDDAVRLVVWFSN